MALHRTLAIILLAVAGCAEPDIVKNLRFEPPLFDSFKSNTYLRYTLLKPATVSIYITDSDGRVIKNIAQNLNQTQGNQSIGWKGDTDEGMFATSGIYIGVVDVKNNKTYKATVEIFHW